MSLQIQNMALDQIRAYAKNAKNHPEGQIQQIAASIRQFGFNNPILVDENLEIIAGHGRVAAAQVLGPDTVPVIRLAHLSEAQKRAYRLADNKIAENGGWNADLLRLEISELEQICGDLDISLTGFSDVELDVLSMDDRPTVDSKANDVPYIPENEIVTRLGDVWCIGDHRIICGNSLDAATFETLLGTRQADMVLQDPPYNVKISGHVCGSGNVRHKEFQMASGEMNTDEFTQFLRKNFDLCAKHSRPGALQYNFMDWRHMGEILAAKFANNCRDVMQSNWYRDLFPVTRLHPSRQAINDFETTQGGGRISTSIGGTFTGRGVDWLIIDDPQKAADANSETARTKLNDWFGTTAYSLLNDKATGKILLVMQRLHQDDLTGHLLDTNAGFSVTKLPVIAVENETWIIRNRIFGITQTITRKQGELLHPMRENAQIVAEIKESMGEYAFVAQYQQDPCPPEGGIVKEPWLHYYTMAQAEGIDPSKYRKIFLSWDTANKTGEQNAYSACCVILMTRDRYKYYLLDVVRGKWEMPDLIKQVQNLYHKWRYEKGGGDLVKLLIEDKASGTQLIQMLSAQRDEYGYRFDVESIKPETDKVSRLMGVSAYIENGTLQFPQDKTPWWAAFKKELLGFPNAKYKDQVDALTQCIIYAQTLI